MTIRLCPHQRLLLPMQSDVLNEQQQISNDTDCSASLSTTLIYSGLKLHPKPLVPTISMPGVASPLSIVKKLSLPDSHLDASRHSSSSTTTTPSAIRLVTPTGKSSSPTNGTFSTSKTYILNPQQSTSTTVTKQPISTPSSSSSLVTLIPPGTTSPKIQTLNSVTISSTNDVPSTDKTSSMFLSKNRVTLVQPLITNSTATSNNITPKLVTTSNQFWQPQSQPAQATKIFSIPPTAKMLSRPVQLIPTSLSSSDHHHHPHITHVKSEKTDMYPSNSSQPAYIHMQLLPSTSNSESMNSSLQLTHVYSSPSSVVISTTPRSMDHNNNHHHGLRETHVDEMHLNKNRTRLPLQPSTQQTSSILTTTMTPSTSTIRQPKKHKLTEGEQISSHEPPSKVPHYEQLDALSSSKKISTSRPRPAENFSIENTTPISSGSTTSGVGKKRYSPETARKRRTVTKLISNENIKQDPTTDSIRQTSSEILIDQIDDELLQRLSQDFAYTDKRTGIRWIGTKSRPKSITTLVSRFSWKPKINHYEKYSDITRTNPKRSVPVKSLETIRKTLDQPWTSWRIDRLTSYLSDLTHEEQMTQNQLAEITQFLQIDDQSIRTTIEDLVEANIQRHRCFCDQLSQVSGILVNLLEHGNTLRDVCSVSKSSTTKRTKER